MKKIVVTLLLVLPFILIYFISFTGQILSTYKHIFVERVVVLDENGDEYKDGDYIKLALEEVYDLNIKVYPELASDKSYTISNGNKSVCSIDEKTNKVTALSYGISKLIITSKDRHFVQFIINIHVTQDEIQDIELVKDTIEISVGKSEQIEVNIIPDTTLPENRELVFEVTDNTVASVSATGVVKGLKYGTTTVVVSSRHKPEISKTVSIVVTLELGKGVFFVNENPSKIYEVNTSTFDLRSITVISRLEGVSISDVWYTLAGTGSDVSSGDIDTSELSNGIIKFNAERKTAIVEVYVYDTVGNEYHDDITLWFISK